MGARRIFVILFCLTVLGTGWAWTAEATEGDTAPAAATAVEGAAASTDGTTTTDRDDAATTADKVTTRPKAKRYPIENDYARVEISDWRASLGRFSLKSAHPIELPEWRGGKPVDTEAPLDVLRLFHDPTVSRASTDMHCYLSGAELEDPGNVPSEPPWQAVSHEPNQVALRHVDEAKGLVYTVTWTMAPDRPTAYAELVVENVGEETYAFNQNMVTINGVHMDDGRSDSPYMAAVASFDHRFQGAEADPDFEKFSLPAPRTEEVIAHPHYETGPFPARRLDYVGLKSRFFTAFWRPGRCVVRDADGDPAAPPPAEEEPDPAGSFMGRAADEEPVSEADQVVNDYRLAIGMRGYEQRFGDEMTGRQALIGVSFFPADRARTTFALAPGQRFELTWDVTVAGMQEEDLALLEPHEQRIEYTDGFYNFFKLLSNILRFFLDIFEAVVINYGVAIILLTLLVKAALHRTNYKQQESMLKMQKLQPELKRIQEQYKNDRQTLAAKQMELFKKHKVNPLGGCLPVLIQMPIFLALYQTFSHSAAMRENGFLWVNDLTLPDQLVYLGFSLPFVGPATINPLPIIYLGVSLWMSFSHKVPEGAGEQQQQMAKMMRWMPVMFGFIFYNMPAGLVLYFCCSAIIGALEIRYIRRKLGMR